MPARRTYGKHAVRIRRDEEMMRENKERRERIRRMGMRSEGGRKGGEREEIGVNDRRLVRCRDRGVAAEERRAGLYRHCGDALYRSRRCENDWNRPSPDGDGSDDEERRKDAGREKGEGHEERKENERGTCRRERERLEGDDETERSDDDASGDT
ncbi:hypothetical protein Tco_0080274 [Tanacetum coccineum]